MRAAGVKTYARDTHIRIDDRDAGNMHLRQPLYIFAKRRPGFRGCRVLRYIATSIRIAAPDLSRTVYHIYLEKIFSYARSQRLIEAT